MAYPRQGERIFVPFRLPVDLVRWLQESAGRRPGTTQNDMVIRALRLLREMTERGGADTMAGVVEDALDDVTLDIGALLPPVTPEWRRSHRKAG